MKKIMTGDDQVVENILGYPITTLDLEACLSLILEWIRGKQMRRYVVCANPHSLAVAGKDSVFEEALHNSDLIVPDGVGILLASQLLGGGIRCRITGSDIFHGLNSALDTHAVSSCFFLGSIEGNLERIKQKMQDDYPNVRVAGTYSPPFKQAFSIEDNLKMIDAINQASPEVLWVGMTAPKQEKWIYQNRDNLNVPVIVAIGAVFDFYAGTFKRSHPVFHRLGLEWLPRLARNPRKLWRRMFVSAPLFLLSVLKQRIQLAGKN